MSAVEETSPVAVPVSVGAVETKTEAQKLEEAVQAVLGRSLACDGLIRGAREAIKALDSKRAQLCVMATDCTEPEIEPLVRALCAQRKIRLVSAGTRATLGQWVGQCKIDREGNPRKVVPCSVAVVVDYGVDSQARNYLLDRIDREE